MRRAVIVWLVLAIAQISCGAPTRLAVSDPIRVDRVRIFDDPATPQTQWEYDPARIEVTAGASVTFLNTGSTFHTVTSDDPGRAFDKGLSPGERVSIRLSTAGTWSYHCGVHPDMKGTIVVR